MPAAHRLGDANTGGGIIQTIPQSTVFTNNLLQAVDGSKGSGHGDPPHCSMCWETAMGASTVFCETIAATYKGLLDTCKHPRTGGSPDVFIEDAWPAALELTGDDPLSPYSGAMLEDPDNPVYGILVDGVYIPNELENNKDTVGPMAGECNQEAAARAGNSQGIQEGIDPEFPNQILNMQIVVGCDLTVDTTMRLGPATVDNPRPNGTVAWMMDPVPGLRIDPTTGRITGVVPIGSYTATVMALIGSTVLDAKKYVIVSAKCMQETSIRFIHPLPGSTRTSPMGMRKPPVGGGAARMHYGCDFAYSGGVTKDVFAAAKGVVIFAGMKQGYGNVIVMGHYNNNGDAICCTLYAHLATFYVQKNAQVDQGQPIGKEGNTGIGTAAHLHFEIRGPNYISSTNPILNKSAYPYDPDVYITGKVTIDAKGDVQASNGVQKDPGTPQSITEKRENTNISLRPEETMVLCRTPQPTVLPAVVDPGAPIISAAGEAKTRYSALCRPTNAPISKQSIITRINAVMDLHPTLDSDDRSLILFICSIESNFNPYATNANPLVAASGSTAVGLFQMIDKTAAAYGLTTCQQRTDVELATEAFISFYTRELLRYYTQWLASGKTTINGRTIVATPHSARYPGLSKRVWIYGLVHHDGVGNAQRGIDLGGLAYFISRSNSA